MGTNRPRARRCNGAVREVELVRWVLGGTGSPILRRKAPQTSPPFGQPYGSGVSVGLPEREGETRMSKRKGIEGQFEAWWKGSESRGKGANKQLARKAWMAARKTRRNGELGVIEEVVGGKKSLDQAIDDVERRVIVAALADTYDNRVQAAELLGVSRSRLYRRMDALDI